MKILILMAYYDRPEIVKVALESVARQSYKNFDLYIVDDGSLYPINDVISKYSDTIKSFHVEKLDYSVNDKLEMGGSIFGKYWNMAIKSSDADIAIMLCDDDALAPGYLEGLSKYYKSHPDIKYSYGHVLKYNPMVTESYETASLEYSHFLNAHDRPINPYCMVDASQVSWKVKDFNDSGMSFPFPQTAALDAAVYKQMYDSWGPCVFNEMITQYKGVFDDQLGARENPFIVVDKSRRV